MTWFGEEGRNLLACQLLRLGHASVQQLIANTTCVAVQMCLYKPILKLLLDELQFDVVLSYLQYVIQGS